MNYLDRLSLWAARRRRAQRLGMQFVRSKTLRLPTQFFVHGRRIEMRFSEEPCLAGDALHVLLDDPYSLERIGQVKYVVDVGANYGFFALSAKSLFPKAIVHCYEPNPDIKQYFEHNITAVGAVPFCEAVSNCDGSCDVVRSRNFGSIGARVITSSSGAVPVISIGKVIERIGGRVDVLKLDCEGSEWEILRDVESLGNVCWLTMEYHDFGFPEGVNDHHQYARTLCAEAGFRVVLHGLHGNSFGYILARNINQS